MGTSPHEPHLDPLLANRPKDADLADRKFVRLVTHPATFCFLADHKYARQGTRQHALPVFLSVILSLHQDLIL